MYNCFESAHEIYLDEPRYNISKCRIFSVQDPLDALRAISIARSCSVDLLNVVLVHTLKYRHEQIAFKSVISKILSGYAWDKIVFLNTEFPSDFLEDYIAERPFLISQLSDFLNEKFSQITIQQLYVRRNHQVINDLLLQCLSNLSEIFITGDGYGLFDCLDDKRYVQPKRLVAHFPTFSHVERGRNVGNYEHVHLKVLKKETLFEVFNILSPIFEESFKPMLEALSDRVPSYYCLVPMLEAGMVDSEYEEISFSIDRFFKLKDSYPDDRLVIVKGHPRQPSQRVEAIVKGIRDRLMGASIEVFNLHQYGSTLNMLPIEFLAYKTGIKSAINSIFSSAPLILKYLFNCAVQPPALSDVVHVNSQFQERFFAATIELITQHNDLVNWDGGSFIGKKIPCQLIESIRRSVPINRCSKLFNELKLYSFEMGQYFCTNISDCLNEIKQLPLSIMFVAHGPNQFNGPNIWLIRLLPALKARGWQPVVLMFMPDRQDCFIVDQLRQEGIRVRIVQWGFTEDSMRAVLHWVNFEKPAVVVPNLNVPTYFLSKYLKAAGIPTVGILHSDDAFYQDLEEEFLVAKQGESLSACVVVSKQQEARIKQGELEGTELVLAPCGAPIPENVCRYTQRTFRCIYVGRLSDKQKRVSDMLAGMIPIMRKISQLEFDLCGEGPARPQLEKLIAESGFSSRIRLYGNLSQDAVRELSLKCQAFVLLSDYEGIPIALMEAMACGLVPICSDIRSGIPELITNGVEGCIVKDRRGALEQAITMLVQKEDQWQRMSQAARTKIITSYSTEQNVDTWDDLLQRLAAQNMQSGEVLALPDQIQLPPKRTNPQGIAVEDHRRPTPQDAFIAPAQLPNNADLYFQRSSILNAIQAHRPFLEGRFLDVGCGIMPYKDLLMQSPSKIETYIGLDIETDIYQADVDLRWDGQRIPLEDVSIDSAMATEVLEHCPDPLVVLREIRRVLKPGGAFFFTVPYIWPLHDAHKDFYRYTPFSLKNLLKEAGFEDLNIRALSGWDASLAQMMGLWMKRAPMSPARRTAMAQKLWPIYQELIESDELPSDPEAGNTMATGWSGLVYAAAESVALPPPPSPKIAVIDLPVVIVRSHAHNYSETFIEDHVQYISTQTTVVYGWPFPRFIEGDRSVLDVIVEKQLVQALRTGKAISKDVLDAYRDGLAKFFKALGVRVALLESGLMGAMVSEACVRAELPHVVHFHGVDAFAYKLLEQWQAHYQRFFRTAAAVVGVSQEMVQQLSTLGAADERLVHAPYGVSTELETYAQPLDAQPVFLSVGRFVAKKAPHKTLQAFEAVYQKVPAARLIMVGEGPMLKKCKAWVQQQGIQEAVTFTGVQSRRSVSRLMARARVFVQHSVVAEDGDHEGLPLAILEAGAHGLPVVATRHAGIPDAVREETDGFLVDEGDVQAMAVAMYRLAQDAALAARMGAAYQQRVRLDYSRAVSIARLQKLLQATAEAGYRKPTDVQTAQSQQKASILSPKPIANLEALKSAIAKENDAGMCLQLGQRASALGDETVAYECYEKAVSLDRSCGPAYLEMGKRLGQAAQYADAYLCLKEAERAGQLDGTSQQLLQALAANPDLQTDSVLQYQQRRQVFDGQLASRPRRILIFTNLLPPQEMGGYGRSIWELCEGLLLRGHTVSILTADVPELQQKAYAGYERVERHVQRNLQLFGGWSQGGAQAIDDVAQIKQIARHNVKVVLHQVSTFQPDVCMVGNLDFLGAGMLDPILKHGVPVLHRLGNGMPGYSAEMTPQSPLYCIAGCSEWVNSELENNGFKAHNFALLPPGSPLHEYYRFVPPNYDQLRICFAGLMMAYKGPHLILEALDYLKKLKIPFSCEFAGDFKDPAFEQQFKQRVRQYQLGDSIRLLGFCDRAQLRAMFDRSNVLVMPSVFEEPFGKVQIEAQAAGLAVVRSPVGGYKDMIEDGVNGLLFKSEDAKDLARQLFVLRGDPGLWSRIAMQGQHDAFRFKTQASVETLEALFEELIARRMTPELQGI